MQKGISKIWILIIIILIVGGFFGWQYYKNKKNPNVNPASTETPSPTVAAEQIVLNYKDIISKMFPEKEFTETEEKHFKDKDNQTYYIENTFENYFTNTAERSLLVVVRRPEEELTQTEGLYNAFLAVFDLKGENILTETFLISADEGKLTLYNCKLGALILFTGSTTSQGWIDGAISLYQVVNKKFERVWPAAEDINDAWADRIADPKEDKIEVYVRKTGIDSSFSCPTKCLDISSESVTPSFVFIYSFDLNWNQEACIFGK
jgi:hypothetical protein